MEQEINNQTNPDTVKSLLDEIQQLKVQNTGVTQVGHELITAQKRLTALLHNASDGIITLNPDGTLESFNISAQKIFGYSEVEVITQNISHLIPCPDWAEHNATIYIRSFLLGRESEDVPIVGRHKNGHGLLLHIVSSEVIIDEIDLFDDVFFDADVLHKKEILVCFIRDVTNNEKLEHELADQKIALDLTSIVATTDAKGTITYVNDKFCDISQYSRDELLGQNHSMLNSGHHPKSMWTEMYKIASSGEAWHQQVCNRAKDGSLYWVDTTILGYKDEQGKLDRYVGIRTDITTQKRLESYLLELVEGQTKDLREAKERAEQAQAEAEAANYAKSDFLANMSHELRTPMHSILSFSKFGIKQIAKQPLEQKGIDKIGFFLSNISESGQRLMGLLNDLLDLAKLEAGKMEYEFKQQDLRLSTDRILTEFTTKLAEKSIELSIESKPNVLAYYDYGKIAQVLANLISNAVKFTVESSEIKIVLEDAEQDQILFSIYDQGIGIPEKELTVVFDQFIQSSKTDTGAGGTGLGLAICKEIINAHNGKIWAENNVSKGVVVKFLLPKRNK